MKIRQIQPGHREWDQVPEALKQAVQVLNDAVEIDRWAVMIALDTAADLWEKPAQQFEKHPFIVVGEIENRKGEKCLRGLGLLSGVLRAICGDQYFIGVETEDDNMTYKHFFVGAR